MTFELCCALINQLPGPSDSRQGAVFDHMCMLLTLLVCNRFCLSVKLQKNSCICRPASLRIDVLWI